LKKRTILAAVTGLSAVSLMLTGCAGSAMSETAATSSSSVTSVTIGTLHPTSGANAVDGQQMENAVDLAIDAVNGAGGIASLGGAKLVKTAGDTQGKAEVGSTEATRLIGEGAVALIGTYQSAVSSNVAAVAERNKVPFIMDVSNADAILKQGYQYSFRLQPAASAMGSLGYDALSAIVKKAGGTVHQIAFLHESGSFGSATLAAFQAAADKAGIKVDPIISYDAASVSDLTTQIQQVASSGADVLAVSGYYRDGVLAAQAISTIKPSLQAVFGVADGAFDQAKFVTDAPNAGKNYFDSNYAIDSSNPDAVALADLYKKTYNEDIRTSAVLAYDAVMVVAQALERSASVDPSALRDAISATDYKPLVVNNGPVKFSETGENLNAGLVATQVIDGAVKKVYPEAVADTTAVFPADVTK
jgi:branched-chain amino acid transport system substrate-binding protein